MTVGADELEAAEWDLSEAQFRCLIRIAGYWQVHGIGPTLRDIGAMLGHTSTNGVREMLDRLERAGVLHLGEAGQPRVIRLTPRGREVVAASTRTIPVLGVERLRRGMQIDKENAAQQAAAAAQAQQQGQPGVYRMTLPEHGPFRRLPTPERVGYVRDSEGRWVRPCPHTGLPVTDCECYRDEDDDPEDDDATP